MIWTLGRMYAAATAGTLAQTGSWREERLQAMHRQFRDSDPQVYMRLVVAVLSIVAIFGIIRLLAWMQRRRLGAVKPQPLSLYMRVQAQLKLPLLDRWRLWRMAKALRIEHPTAMLISPVLYDEAVQRYGQGRAGTQARLANIRLRLFGRATPEPLDPPPPAG
ncbi:MAG: hypothetical protein HY718_09020 [Planctomycetes bacterium]|nr:hypothetical protein [Planctomycetota bacterium]